MSATWRANFGDAILLDPLILVHGNVKDVFPLDEEARSRMPAELRGQSAVTFDVWLALELEREGFDIVCLYDPITRITVLRRTMAAPLRLLLAGQAPPASAGAVAPRIPANKAEASTPVAPPASGADWLVALDEKQVPKDFVRNLLVNVMPRTDVRVAVVFRFMDRFLQYTDRQDCNDRELSLLIQKAALAVPADVQAGGSRMVLVFDLETQVPQEINTLFPAAHSVFVPPPTLEEREQFFQQFGGRFNPGAEAPVDLANAAGHRLLLAQLSDGLRMQDLHSLTLLSHREQLGLSAKEFPLLIARFKFGTRENAWAKLDAERLRTAKQTLQKRVKGQDEVIDEVVPVLIRAKLGMSDLAGSVASSKPRGAFFFVGPTGVGKTELSKAIAELIFGDERSLLRFDMSEYSEEHQQARLIGAPPGYVGFDQGGQLTNAVHQKPFSVVLFDEIEKAHGRILDKFLQILDDGRLTDGMGKTVYFSESIIIFTSNIGTAPPKGGSTDDTYGRLGQLSYEEICRHFRGAVREYFVNMLGRPEILNRIGEDNVLVFKMLNSGDAKSQIIAQLIENMRVALRERQPVDIHCTSAFKRLLAVHPSGFDRNGARGVRNLLNRYVLNRLASDLFLEPKQCRGRILRIDYEASDEDIDTKPFQANLLRYEWIDA